MSVGIFSTGICLPHARNENELWEVLCAGKPLFKKVPESRFDTSHYAPAFIDPKAAIAALHAE